MVIAGLLAAAKRKAGAVGALGGVMRADRHAAAVA
jgi:hypothetical protein